MSLPNTSEALEDWFVEDSMKLTVPLPPNKANARMNWRVALAAKKAYWRELDALRLTGGIPKPPVKAPSIARVRSTAFVWSPCDYDNLIARYKPLLDYLVAWGYLAGDDPKHLKLEMPNQEIDRANQRIEIELEAA